MMWLMISSIIWFDTGLEEKTHNNNKGEQQDFMSQQEASSKEEPKARTQTDPEDWITQPESVRAF